MNQQVAISCTQLSDQEKISFPEVLSCLREANIGLYYTDLIASTKTYYAGNEAFTLACQNNFNAELGETFNSEQIAQAIKQSQNGHIQYQEFKAKALKAGVIGYFIFVQGKKALYLGQKGEQYIEHFPAQ